MSEPIDILEDRLLRDEPGLLEVLLVDHSTQKNIFWATDDYASLGEAYSYYAPITIPCITGDNGFIIQPRVLKTREEQANRTKDKAEVFTPKPKHGQPQLNQSCFLTVKHGRTMFAPPAWKSHVVKPPILQADTIRLQELLFHYHNV